MTNQADLSSTMEALIARHGIEAVVSGIAVAALNMSKRADARNVADVAAKHLKLNGQVLAVATDKYFAY